MELLRPDGKPVDTIATEAKKAHDSKEFKATADRMANLFEQLFRGWMEDMTPDPSKPPVVRPDAKAVRALWGERWVEQVRVVKNSSTPCVVNEDDLYNAIDAHMARAEEQARSSMPLGQVRDLEPMGFRLVGRVPEGELWINQSCALAISEEGIVHFWLRGAHEPGAEWTQGWMPAPVRLPLRCSAEISIKTVNAVLGAMGVANHVPLDETEMGACRTVHTIGKERMDPFTALAATGIVLFIVYMLLGMFQLLTGTL